MTPKKLKYIQILFEGLIPLLGYFLWDWSLYFILLFYLMDLIVDEVFANLKSKHIIKAQSLPVKKGILNGVVGFTLLIVIILGIHLTMPSIQSNIVFIDEIILFWTYEELGIQQGLLLVPLVVFGAYQKYKLEFLQIEKYKTINFSQFWKQRHFAFILVIISSVSVFVLEQFIHLHELIYVLAIVLSIAAFQLWVKKG